LCVASNIRAMPENEKPPARRVDVYYAIEKFDFLWHRSLREDAHAASRKFK
jgi:hypothetical protein